MKVILLEDVKSLGKKGQLVRKKLYPSKEAWYRSYK